mgnify:CR=1 FL=1
MILGWGSTYGSIRTAVREAIAEGYDVSHIHLRYLNPFPKNLEELIKRFDKIIVPEMNNGQLVRIIRDKYLVDAKGFNKIKGTPFNAGEILEKIRQELN